MSSDLGRRIGLTIVALLVVRLGTYISIPGINPQTWDQIFRQQSGSILGAFDSLAGGGIGRLSIFALSIMPFVSASLLMQLASIVSARLRALPRQGESGRRRLDVYTLALTIVFAAVQALGIAQALEGVGNVVPDPGMTFRLTTTLTLTGGVIFLVWLAGQITARGIGNGLALILAVGIVAELPTTIVGMLGLGRRGMVSPNVMLGVCFLAIALTALVVYMELARRQLQVTFCRQVGTRTIEGRSQLRLKLNNAGFVPTILASWLLLLPLAVADLDTALAPEWIKAIVTQLAHGRPLFLVVYGVAIVLCVFFYTAHLLNPDEIAEDLKKHGGVIAGVEPGEATANHIDQVISRLSAVGAVYLVFVCLIPEILIAKWSVPFYLGGTSLLIVVCAILDLMAQLGRLRRGGEAT
ncbi:MAG TPA: preprotein translocase subunit SecY [Xanthobacteraceae bacterium]|nr:preprotein translocase subunit SecY [Xanthobacteraceae bacterium]